MCIVCGYFREVVVSLHCFTDNNFLFCQQGNKLLSDSGNIIDKRYRGGRLGMYVFSQTGVYYSALLAGSPEVGHFSYSGTLI